MWQHFDDGSCPGQGIGVRARLENGLSGFVHTKNLSDSQVNAPEERVHVRGMYTYIVHMHSIQLIHGGVHVYEVFVSAGLSCKSMTALCTCMCHGV